MLKNLSVNKEKNNQLIHMQIRRPLQNIALFLINVAFHGFENDFKN